MTADLDAFRDTTAHRRPGRVLYSAGFTPDLRRRVIEHIGTEEIADHYGFFRPVNLSPRRPPESQPPDYSAYWADGELPEGTKINAMGVAEVPSGFYHCWGYVSPLRNAKSLSELENYQLD